MEISSRQQVRRDTKKGGGILARDCLISGIGGKGLIRNLKRPKFKHVLRAVPKLVSGIRVKSVARHPNADDIFFLFGLFT